MGDLLVIGILAVIVVFCARSVYKSRKTGGCSGNCSNCKNCSKGKE